MLGGKNSSMTFALWLLIVATAANRLVNPCNLILEENCMESMSRIVHPAGTQIATYSYTLRLNRGAIPINIGSSYVK